MTRIAVLSDIHGNLPALQAVMTHMAQFSLDHVVVAGDVVNWGPFSAQVTEIVMNNHWSVIRGNNEYYLLDYDTVRQPESWREYGLMPWLKEQLRGKWQHVIAGWPDVIQLRYSDAPPIVMFHGTPDGPWAPIFPQQYVSDEDVAQILAPIDASTVICGHSHLALDRQVERWHIINPGTVGVPLDGDLRAQYAILDGDEQGWKATFHRVDYDQTPLYEEFEQQQFVERYGAEAFLVIEEFKTAYIQLHTCQHWRRDAYPDAPFTLAMAREFLTLDTDAYRPAPYQIKQSIHKE